MPNLAPNPAYGAGLPTGWTVQNALSTNNGGGDQSLVSGGSAPTSGLGFASPARNALLAETFDPMFAVAGASAMTTGKQYASKFYWSGGNMTNAWIWVNSAATTTTHGWLAVYDGSGTLWAQTADQAASAFKATGAVEIAFTAVTPVPAGWYYGYMATVFSAGTLEVAGLSGIGNALAAEINVAAGSWDFASNATTVSALPASLTWGTGWAADTAIGMWFGVS